MVFDYLVADIGGTYARFALYNPALDTSATHSDILLEHIKHLECADYPQIEDAIAAYMAHYPQHQLKGACLAIAAPINNKIIKLTNNPWSFDIQTLEKHLKIPVYLVNDFAVIAYALPYIKEANRIVWPNKKHIVLDRSVNGHYAVVGPGTGFGVASLVIHAGKMIPIATEGGHVSFSPIGDIQIEILKYLKRSYQRVSNERLLSGKGLVNIYQALNAVHDTESMTEINPKTITSNAVNKQDVLCKQTMDIFCEILGAVAGDIALTSGTVDGVFIAGGILPDYAEFFINSNFRKCFEDKGRYHNYMSRIKTELITHPYIGLVGAAISSGDIDLNVVADSFI